MAIKLSQDFTSRPAFVDPVAGRPGVTTAQYQAVINCLKRFENRTILANNSSMPECFRILNGSEGSGNNITVGYGTTLQFPRDAELYEIGVGTTELHRWLSRSALFEEAA